MKAAVVALLLSTASLFAQTTDYDPSNPLRKGAWDLGVWVSGGTSIFGGTEDTSFVNVGLRVGRVLTGSHGKSWYRGNLQAATEIIPLALVFQPSLRFVIPQGPPGPAGPTLFARERETVYGAGLNPLILKWNFSGARKYKPYIELGGGMLITVADVPQFTYKFNFTPQFVVGTHYLTAKNRSISFDVKYQHVSNAGLASLNPGINTVQLAVSYHWFR
jgi:lipid A 3-O-deacylase